VFPFSLSLPRHVIHPPYRCPLAQGPPPQGPIKFTIADTLERIKEEFNFLQAQYHRQVTRSSGTNSEG